MIDELKQDLQAVEEKSDVQSLQADLNALNETMYEAVQVHKEAIRSKFHESFAIVFKQYPEVKVIAWSQGTPEFCDGEPCYFSVNEPSVLIGDKVYGHYDHGIEVNGEEVEYDDLIYPTCYDDEYIANSSYLTEEDKCDEEKERAVAIFEAIRNLITSFEDILEDMFDGDARITVTPDGISHEWYDVGY